jgi:hypothetical protein
MYFSFGDIRDTKNLQTFVVIMRFVVIAMMISSTVFYIGKDGAQHTPVFDWTTHSTAFATAFGNTVFTFVYQPAVPGII